MEPKVELQAIAAMAENRVIGDGGRIPWHLPEDFRWFKQKTMGHVLLMGRKTFESIGRPLSGRLTVVLSRSGRAWAGAETIRSLEELPRLVEGRTVFVCGGSEIYGLCLPACADLFLTHVHQQPQGKILFPPFEDRFVPLETVMERPTFHIVHYRNRSPRTLAAVLGDAGAGR